MSDLDDKIKNRKVTEEQLLNYETMFQNGASISDLLLEMIRDTALDVLPTKFLVTIELPAPEYATEEMAQEMVERKIMTAKVLMIEKVKGPDTNA